MDFKMNSLLKWIAKKIMMPCLVSEKEKMEVIVNEGEEKFKNKVISEKVFFSIYGSNYYFVIQIKKIIKWLSNK